MLELFKISQSSAQIAYSDHKQEEKGMTPSALAQTKQYEFDQEKEVIASYTIKYVLMCAV